MYQIEKGIEVPPKKSFARSTIYPFATMEVGDSFFVPQVDGKPKKRRISTAVRPAGYQKTRLQVHRP